MEIAQQTKGFPRSLPPLEIRVDDLRGPQIIALLEQHLHAMYSVSPPESVHALDLSGLRRPEITFWAVWSAEVLAGCGALKEISSGHAEIKSMRTADAFQRQGVAAHLLRHILAQARQRGYARVSLETGSQPYFEPARRLYASFGFEVCGPFEGYAEDPHSVFMSLRLQP